MLKVIVTVQAVNALYIQATEIRCFSFVGVGWWAILQN